MKKIFSYILIIVILAANIFAPISVGWNQKIKFNLAEAETVISSDYNMRISASVSATDNSVSLNVSTQKNSETSDKGTGYSSSVVVVANLKNKDGANVGGEKRLVLSRLGLENNNPLIFSNLDPNSPYILNATVVEQTDYSSGGGSGGSSEKTLGSLISSQAVKTNPTGVTTSTDLGSFSAKSGSIGVVTLPECRWDFWNTIGGCAGVFLYKVIFVPTSYLFAAAGMFFDSTFAYSVQSSSYQSTFVVEGWGVVRDFCNMFFIFILLYIAFGTILDLNGVKTKEMIINVIIIGLLINFSLFAVRLIVDSSNILARVFYNDKAITVNAGDAGSQASDWISKATKNGVIPLSAALVNKVDPQRLIIQSSKVDDIEDNSGNNAESDQGVPANTFIIVTILAIAINITGLFTFLSVGLIFVGRVVGLWISMILAPFAFFSYAVPAMRNIEFVGWKKWWPEMIKLAFLAPVFIFFMYLILQFLNKGLGIISADGKTGVDFVIAIMIPFIFIIFLLIQAKNIAKTMSGRVATAVTNAVSGAGKLVGGVALGAATGGAALLGRATVGSAMSRVAKSDALRKQATDKNAGAFSRWVSRKTLKSADSLSKSSFDARNTKAAKFTESKTGINMTKVPGFLKPKEGGYSKYAEDRRRNEVEKAERYKVSGGELKETLENTEKDYQGLLRTHKETLDNFDKEIEKKRKELSDVNQQYGGGSEESKKAGAELSNAKRKKKAFIEGDLYEGDKIITKKEKVDSETGLPLVGQFEYIEDVDNNTRKDYRNDNSVRANGKTIDELEKQFKQGQEDIETENRERMLSSADNLSKSWFNRKIKKGAAKEIREKYKIDSGKKV